MTTIRQQRASELLYEELTVLINSELSDPRLSYLNVIEVDISRDLRNAKIFIYHQDDETSKRDVMKGLKKATPFLRRQLAKRCNFRVVPELLFHYDDTPGKAARIDELLGIAKTNAISQGSVSQEPILQDTILQDTGQDSPHISEPNREIAEGI